MKLLSALLMIVALLGVVISFATMNGLALALTFMAAITSSIAHEHKPVTV